MCPEPDREPQVTDADAETRKLDAGADAVTRKLVAETVRLDAATAGEDGGLPDAASPDAGSPANSMVGTLLVGRYRLDGVIGRGGMSTVYRATDTQLVRTVAIKSFRPDLADADDIRRQRDEVQLLASLNHPTLVTLYDSVADEQGRASLVLEHVDGRDLRETLAAGPIDERTVALVGLDIASALAYVHDRGIVHRDLKPGNVLIPNSRDGARAKLADFGIARLVDETRMTATGTLIGTAAYLSPEQALGGAIAPASDVYSLGLVLLECLTGTRAYEGSSIEAAIARLNRDPQIPETLGPVWVDLLKRMTARDAGDRITARDAAPVFAELAARAAASDPQVYPTPRDVSATEPPHHTGTGATQFATKLLPATQYLTNGLTLSGTPARPADAERTRLLEAPPPAPPRPSRRRLILVIIIGIICALAIPIAITAISGVTSGTASPTPSSPASPTPTPPTPVSPSSYPTVNGTVGDHLKQLQKSVEK